MLGFTGTKVPILTQQQLDSMQTEFAKEDMSRWESAYNIRPPPSDLPAGFGVLCRTSDSRLCSLVFTAQRKDKKKRKLQFFSPLIRGFVVFTATILQLAAVWTADDLCCMNVAAVAARADCCSNMRESGRQTTCAV